MKSLSLGLGLAVLVVRAVVTPAVAQAVFSTQAFAVVSIKPVTASSAQMPPMSPAAQIHTVVEYSPLRLHAVQSLGRLILFAYGIAESQLIGNQPDLLYQFYEITGTTDAPATREEMASKLRTALEDRFQLRVHWEPREMDYYALEVSPEGTKLTPLAASDPAPVGKGPEMTGRSIHDLVNMLNVLTPGGMVKFPVVDETGLKGEYAIRLHLDGEQSECDGCVVFTNPIDIGKILEEQMGLTLVQKRGPVPYLFLDSVQAPTAN